MFKAVRRSVNDSLSVRIPEKSTSATVLIKRVLPSPEGSKKYPSVSVVFLSKCTIPYVYKKQSVSMANGIKETDTFFPIVMEGGGTTHFISMFSVPAGIDSGAIVVVGGLYYTAYRRNDDTTGYTFTCVKLTKCESQGILNDVWKLPAKLRTFDPELDVVRMGYDMERSDKERRYTFFAVNVKKGVTWANDGMLYGEFQVPPMADANSYSFQPFQENKSQVPDGRLDALTGGTCKKDNRVLDNQFMVCKSNEDGSVNIVSVRCRLYGDSIQRFLVGAKWSQLGPVIVPHLFGTALCISDAGKTAEQVYDSNDGIYGAMYSTVTFFPDLARIAAECGIPCTWAEAEKITHGLLATPAALSNFSTTAPPSLGSLAQSTAINLLEFKGDASRIKLGVEQGELKLYVVCNLLDRFKRDITATKKLTLVEAFTEPNYTENFYDNNMAVAIYVTMADLASHVRVQDFLLSHPDLPARVDTIQMRSAKKQREMAREGEEEGEGEEEVEDEDSD